MGVIDFKACDEADDPLKYWVDYLFLLLAVCYSLMFKFEQYS